MNKSKLLTSMSALVAVIAFAGEAVAGSSTPKCELNHYYIDVSGNADAGGIFGSLNSSWMGECSGEECEKGECPSLDGSYTCWYNVDSGKTTCYLPDSTCASALGNDLTSWNIYTAESYTGTPIATVAPGEVIPNNVLARVSSGSTLYAQAVFAERTYGVSFNCTASANVASTAVTSGSITVKGTAFVDLSERCNVAGYTTTWQYQVNGTGSWRTVTGTSIAIGDLADGSTVVFKSAYTPKTYNVAVTSHSGGTTYTTLTYTNRTSLTASPVWKLNGSTVTTITLPTRTSYELRGISGKCVADVSVDNATLSDLKIKISAQGNTTSATLPSLGVLTANQTYCGAWASKCNPGTGAICTLTITPATGAVAYQNSCQTGYHM